MPAAEATRTNQARILVVDDDEALLRLIRLALASEDFEVRTARDGLEGLEALEDHPFDLIVLDLQMPRMSGESMYAELRARGHTLPVLILSAYGAERARIQLRADAAMGKPFDVDLLIDRIRALLSVQSPEED